MADGSCGSESGRVRLSAGSLSRYFSGAHRQTGGSNFASMCEAAARVTHASIPCRTCDGMGFRALGVEELARWKVRIAAENVQENREQLRARLSDESVCSVCNGSGYTTPKNADRATPMDGMFTTVRCSKCRGCGETLHPNDESAEVEDVCQHCKGPGFVVPVTVREKGSSKSGRPPKREAGDGDDYGENELATASWVDEDALVELGRASHVLTALRAADPESAAALAAYHGEDGDKWGGHRWGRIFAVWPLTDAGGKLARESAERSRRMHGYLIRPIDLIAGERDAELRAQTPNPRRRALLAQADAQARQLLRRAEEALRIAEGA